jgi:hypothetical protein
MRPDIREAIDGYAKNRDTLGGFLTAVMENDLLGAFERADNGNQRDMLEIVTYVYMHVPRSAWGSPERVTAWLAGPEEKPYEPVTGDRVEVLNNPKFEGWTGIVQRLPFEPLEGILVEFPIGVNGCFLPAQLRKMN